MKNPCSGKKCSFGAKCVSSLDGLSARCQCPEVCYNFGDNEGSTVLCGTDGKDYSSTCRMQQTSCREMKNVKKKYEGLCDPCNHFKCPDKQICKLTSRRQPRCRCPNTCADVYQPVCSSDGLTYVNQCTMELQACRLARPLKVIAKGNCSANNPCSAPKKCEFYAECVLDDYEKATCECVFSCERVANPVCGSDGRTYDSLCHMKKHSCMAKKGIKAEKEGICDDVFMKADANRGEERQSCETHKCWHDAKCVEREGGATCVCVHCSDQATAKICASNNRTYNNHCQLRHYNCLNKKKVFLLRHGTCGYEAPKDCEQSKFGCCLQGGFEAQGPAKQGCPEVCQCNQHGSVGPLCDPKSLKCTCKAGVSGSKCDRCAPNYWAFHKIRDGLEGCKACKCNAIGSVRADCEQTNGSCACRYNFTGHKCQFCPDGKAVKRYGCSHHLQGDDARCMEGVTCKYGGRCVKVGRAVECVCPASCLPSPFQVCGSDGSTYQSLCQLEQSSCRFQREVTVLHDGACVAGRSITNKRSVKFDGKTFYNFKNSRRNSSHFSFITGFSIMGKDGVLFLETKNYKASSAFLGIFVRKGKVMVVFNLGQDHPKKLPSILSQQRVDDGRWHELKVTRSGRHVDMVLDKEEAMHASALPGTRNLHASDLFSIGGSKKRMRSVCGGSRCRNQLSGCLLRLEINGVTVNFESEALNTSVHYCTN